MALRRSIGNVVTISAGRTHLWHISYGNGQDVGVVVAGPNLQQSQINVELIAFDQGVVGRQSSDAGALTDYTVKIRNAGAATIGYNLNIGDWLPEGSPPPAAHLVRNLPPVVGGGIQPPIAIAAKKRAKRPAGGSKKRARRR